MNPKQASHARWRGGGKGCGVLTDVVVVGGGLSGLMAAERLAREGLFVTVVDRGEPGAAWGGTGLVAPVLDGTAPDALWDLVDDAVRRWPDWLVDADLEEQVPRARGLLAAAESPFHRQELERIRGRWQRRHPAVDWLTGSSLAGTVAGLGRHVEAGLLHHDALRVDPHRLGALLAASIQGRGARIRWGTPALALEVRGDRVHGVRLPGEILPGGAVVLATGAEAAGLWPEAAAPLPASVQRWTSVTLVGVAAPRVPIAGRGRMVLPLDSGAAALVSVADGADYRSAPSAAGLRRALDAADLLPAMAEGRVVGLASRLTPALPGGLPLLGGWPGLEGLGGLVAAVGVGPHGLTLAPLMSDVVYALLCDVPVPFDLDPFRPDRGED